MPSVRLMTDAGLVPITAALAALADESRWQIVEVLRAGPRTVNEVASAFDLSRTMVSRHLSALRAVGVVRAEKSGTSVRSSIDREVVRQLADRLARLADEPSGLGLSPAAAAAFGTAARRKGGAVAPADLLRMLLSAEAIAERLGAAGLDLGGLHGELERTSRKWKPAPGLPDEAINAILAGAVSRSAAAGKPSVSTFDLAVASLDYDDGALAAALDEGDALLVALGAGEEDGNRSVSSTNALAELEAALDAATRATSALAIQLAGASTTGENP